MIVRVDMPKPLAKDLGCQVPNEAKITFAPGGSDQNTDPTNDDASAVANVPAHICNPPLTESNLKIDKFAPANAVCQHAVGEWCRVFKITVTNTGPDAFNGVIKVTDTPSIGTITNIGGAGWTCVGYTCTTNAAVPLQKNPPSGDEVSFHATVRGSKAEAMAAGCKLTNTAKIDAPLGVPQNVVAPDDTSQVMVDLPAELCDTPPEKTHLKLEKQADANGCLPGDGVYHCYYNVIVTNAGPGTYNDKIVVNEFIPAGTTAAFSWACVGGTCTKNGVVLQPNEKIVMGAQINVPTNLAQQLDCQVLNLAKITYAAGGSHQNTDATDDQDQVSASLPASLCTTTPPVPQCPPGFVWTGEKCDRPDTACKSGWTLTAGSGKCCPPGRPWNRRLGKCGDDDTPPPPPECPTHWATTPVSGKCCPPGKPWNRRSKQCGDDDTPPPPRCPDGMIGTPPNCKLPPGPTCNRTARCLNGLSWSFDRCACICAGNRVMKHGQCVSDDPKCPKGMIGTPPNCKPKSCPPGMVGFYPRCKKDPGDPPKVCPPGTRGHYPRCKKIDVPPKLCPPGTRGRYPRCKRIVVPPKACPPGTFGRPPRCRAIRLIRPHRPHRLRMPGGRPLRLMMRPNFGARGLR